MRDDEVRLVDPLIVEQEDVDVDDARSPASRPAPAARTLDSLRRGEQPARRAAPLAFHDLVEKPRLVGNAPWLRLDDRALAQDPESFLTQPASRSAEIARANPEV